MNDGRHDDDDLFDDTLEFDDEEDIFGTRIDFAEIVAIIEISRERRSCVRF